MRLRSSPLRPVEGSHLPHALELDPEQHRPTVGGSANSAATIAAATTAARFFFISTFLPYPNEVSAVQLKQVEGGRDDCFLVGIASVMTRLQARCVATSPRRWANQRRGALTRCARSAVASGQGGKV
jgi:hypothetical protein